MYATAPRAGMILYSHQATAPPTGTRAPSSGKSRQSHPYYEEFVPTPRAPIPPHKSDTFDQWKTREWQIVFTPEDAYPASHEIYSIPLTHLLEGRGLQAAGTTPFKNHGFKVASVGFAIKWPGYEHMDYSVEMYIANNEGKFVTLAGIGYYVAVNYRDYIKRIEACRIECRHPDAARWRLGGPTGLNLSDISLVYITNISGNVWQAVTRVRRPQ